MTDPIPSTETCEATEADHLHIEVTALRVRLAETEAALVGAMNEAAGALAYLSADEPRTDEAYEALEALVHGSAHAALGARVIEEAYEQGARDAAAGKLAMPNKFKPDPIEAAREEGRAEERKLWQPATAHTAGLVASAQGDVERLTAERDGLRAALVDDARLATATLVEVIEERDTALSRLAAVSEAAKVVLTLPMERRFDVIHARQALADTIARTLATK